MQANAVQSPAFQDKSARANTANLIRSSIRNTLRQACDLKDLAYEVAMQLRAKFQTEEECENERTRAQAITALTKSWAESADVMRIARGKPLPGSLRPESKPKKPKRSKAQVTLLDQDQPCGPAHTASGVPSQSSETETPQDSPKP